MSILRYIFNTLYSKINGRTKTMQSGMQLSIFFLLLTVLVILSESCPAGENTPATNPANRKVSWSDLIFAGSKFSTEFKVEMRLESMNDSSGSIPSPQEREWGACPEAVHDGMLLTIKATSQGLGAEDKYVERVWFDEHDVPYRRNRLNLGDAFWMKSYCWEDKGVRRHKVAPGTPAEKKLPATGWSQHTESLYRYPGNLTGCSTISDPALIVYEVSILTSVIGQDPFELCVFGKKQLHRLTITQEETLPLEVAYTVRSAELKETVVEGQILPVVYAVTSENMAAANQTPETFSLFGLQKDIRIYLDPEKGIPVRISGTAGNIGTLELDMQDANIN
jgi:hypothetical protein